MNNYSVDRSNSESVPTAGELSEMTRLHRVTVQRMLEELRSRHILRGDVGTPFDLPALIAVGGNVVQVVAGVRATALQRFRSPSAQVDATCATNRFATAPKNRVGQLCVRNP